MSRHRAPVLLAVCLAGASVSCYTSRYPSSLGGGYGVTVFSLDDFPDAGSGTGYCVVVGFPLDKRDSPVFKGEFMGHFSDHGAAPPFDSAEQLFLLARARIAWAPDDEDLPVNGRAWVGAGYQRILYEMQGVAVVEPGGHRDRTLLPLAAGIGIQGPEAAIANWFLEVYGWFSIVGESDSSSVGAGAWGGVSLRF
ncbi:MAG: hypothetical protein ACYS9X_05655 [Planctomycetota bacterium]|jgi:hypothetical protein